MVRAAGADTRLQALFALRGMAPAGYRLISATTAGKVQSTYVH